MTGKKEKLPVARRPHRHQRLRHATWFGIALALLVIPVSLFFYAKATILCLGTTEEIGWCDLYTAAPWLAFVLTILVYLFVFGIIHELGHEGRRERGEAAGRLNWRNARHGYKHLDEGHHRLVRRTHRVAWVGLAMLAGYGAFMFLETDTAGTLLAALLAYAIGERLNWKRYPDFQVEPGSDKGQS